MSTTNTILSLRTTLYFVYMQKWMKDHVPFHTMCIELQNFSNSEYQTFEEYVKENGFNGSCYASYEEFLNNEYLDEAYIHELIKVGFKDVDTAEYIYLQDLKQRKKENECNASNVLLKQLKCLEEKEKNKDKEQKLNEQYKREIKNLLNCSEIPLLLDALKYALKKNIMFCVPVSMLRDGTIFYVYKDETIAIKLKRDGLLNSDFSLLVVVEKDKKDVIVCSTMNGVEIKKDLENEKEETIKILQTIQHQMKSLYKDLIERTTPYA